MTENPPSTITPAVDAFAITPGSSELSLLPRAIYVGGGGSLVVRFPGAASDVTFTGIASGSVLPIRPSHVKTGGTATGIIGLL